MQSILHHNGIGVGNFFLGHLLVGKEFALRFTAQGAFTHHVDSFSDNTHAAHSVVYATTAKASLGN